MMKRTITVLGVSAVGLALAAPSIAQFDDSDSDLRQLVEDGNRAGLAGAAVPRFTDRKIQVLVTEGTQELLDRGGIINQENVDALWVSRVVSS